MTYPEPTFYFPAPVEQHFCSQCGSKLSRKIPADDNRVRDLCENCGAIHYKNPLIVVGTIPVWEDKILLCRRAIEPRHGKWTLPAGFMELSETSSIGAIRETTEEAGAEITLKQLFTVIDVPHVNQVHMYFLANANNERLDPGPESLDARYFSLDEIPWDELSFRTVTQTIKRYIEDCKQGVFTTHYFSLT